MDDRKSERSSDILLAALRRALADAGEHRLFKSGKFDGLFPSRNGLSGDAAAEALRQCYLETVRTELKGRVSIEWVRLSPAGVEFIYRHDSPRAVLEEMRALMSDARSGVPRWLNAILGEMQKLSKAFGDEMQRYMQRLDGLTGRIEEAIRRSEAGVTLLADPMQALVPWGVDALSFLDRRKQSGTTEPCPLPDLFSTVRKAHPLLSVADFQKGLKRLADARAITLLPYAGNGRIPQPEHAIPDGAHMLYLVAR